MKYFYLLLLLFSFSTVQATDIDMVGDWTFHINGETKRVTIKGYRIENQEDYYTGTIKIKVYLGRSEYVRGSSNRGIFLCEFRFEKLDADEYYYDISKSEITTASIPDGFYYPIILLEEYDLEGYVVRDHMNFGGINYRNAAQLSHKLGGSWSYTVNRSEKTISLVGGSIINNSSYDADGYRLEFLISENPIGNNSNVYMLGQSYFDVLETGYSFTDVSRVMDFKFTPDAGIYYAAVQISIKRSDGSYSPVHHLNFNGTLEFY